MSWSGGFYDSGGVHGLTTAATIWLVASIGMACGGRFYPLALITTLIAILVLIGLGKLARPLEHYREKSEINNIPKDQG